MGVCRRRSGRFAPHLGLLLILVLLALVPSSAQAQKNGCTFVRAGFSELTCQYRASGPGRYRAYLEMTRAAIRVNGVTRVALASSHRLQHGRVPSHRGDLVSVTIARDCNPMLCIEPPSAAYIQVQNR